LVTETTRLASRNLSSVRVDEVQMTLGLARVPANIIGWTDTLGVGTGLGFGFGVS